MSGFVDSGELFTVKVKFKFVNEEEALGVKLLPRDAEGEDVQEIICKAIGADFITFSPILEAATVINNRTGNPMLRSALLCPKIITTFFKHWNIVDEETDKPIEINMDSVGKLHYVIVTALVRRWLAGVSGLVIE